MNESRSVDSCNDTCSHLYIMHIYNLSISLKDTWEQVDGPMCLLYSHVNHV
jgi:hypothetical protein